MFKFYFYFFQLKDVESNHSWKPLGGQPRKGGKDEDTTKKKQKQNKMKARKRNGAGYELESR